MNFIFIVSLHKNVLHCDKSALVTCKCISMICLVAQIVKESALSVGNLGSILGLGRPWRRKWQPNPYCCLENPMGRGACQAIVHGFTKSQTRDYHFTSTAVFLIRLSSLRKTAVLYTFIFLLQYLPLKNVGTVKICWIDKLINTAHNEFFHLAEKL